MRKLAAVEDARAIMKEGMEWGVWKWLTEKPKVRRLADKARAALDENELKVKESWPDELKLAYNSLVSENGTGGKRKRQSSGKANGAGKPDPKVLAQAKQVLEADDTAYNAHEDAEDVFAEAEKKMSTSMAREGARMALVAYDRHEEAIRKAEALLAEK